MTVYINARFLTQPVSGVQRYAHEILNALDQLLSQNQETLQFFGPFVALCPHGRIPKQRWNKIEIRQIGKSKGHIWEQTSLNIATRDGILVSLGNSGPLFHSAQILALHDANIWDIPLAFSARYRLLHKTIRPLLAKRAQGLLSVSRYSANRLADRLNILPQRFAIVPNGADHITKIKEDSDVLQRFDLVKNGYLLSVGNQSPNKNIHRLIQAHGVVSAQVPPLVVIGGQTSGLQAQSNKAFNNVKFLGRVDDAALRGLYENAKGFVFPSLYEGFGIPPLESMLLGTPVLASQKSALPEILQDGVMWFDPLDIDDMTKSMIEFAELTHGERDKLIARGHAIADKFRWSRSAQLLLDQILALKKSKSNGVPDVHNTSINLQIPIS